MGTNMDTELDRFKTSISLADYAAGMGYGLDRKASCANSLVLRRSADNDKIVVARKANGHWVYFSVRDAQDNGTVVDFHQKRTGQNLGETRKALRAWSGASAPYILPLPLPTPANLAKMLANYSLTEPSAPHPYLENARAIGKEILTLPRFEGRIRIDRRGNAIFPHFGKDGELCGYEIKNLDFTGFASGGNRGLWLSHIDDGDKGLVVCESAIDALSFAELIPNDQDAYASTGGALSDSQLDLIASTAKAHGLKVVLAFDNDEGGLDFTLKTTKYLLDLDIPYLIKRPERRKDWNEILKIGKTAR